MNKLQELQERLEGLNSQAMTIRNRAEHEQRDLSDDELTEVDKINSEYSRITQHIAVLSTAEDNAVRLAQGTGAQTAPQGQSIDDDGGPVDNAQGQPQQNGAPVTTMPAHSVSMRMGYENDKGKRGFASLGDFAYSCRMAGNPNGSAHVDPRLRILMNDSPSNPSSNDGATGFLVPPDFRRELVNNMYDDDSLLPRTDQITTRSNNITLRIDEDQPWGDDGIQVYWGKAGRQKQQSNLTNVEPRSFRLHELYALVPVEDDHLDDAPALDGLLRRKAPMKMNWAITTAIMNGSGVGEPTGILNHRSTVVVPKVAGQAPGTIVFQNTVDLWARLPQRCRSRSVWLANSDIEPQLMTMGFPSAPGSSTNTGPVYLPPGGAAATPYGTLFGRPVIPIESGSGLGQKGDLMLTDLGQYLTVLKGNQPKVDVSIHLWFDFDVTAYRFVFRMTGRPWWGAPIERPAPGALAQSCAAVLEERA